MRTSLVRVAAGVTLLGLAAVGACGDDGSRSREDATLVVVTTNILGDVVGQLVGHDSGVGVEVIMPPNANPHDFAPSARQAQVMREAGVLVVNGLGFEAGLEDTIDAAAGDGVEVVTLTDLVPGLLPPGGQNAGEDPHVFTDPARMATAVRALGDELAVRLPALDTPQFGGRVGAYVASLEALDREVEAILAAVPSERRRLVTNHEVFSYFADRYGFEVLGAVIPSTSTLAEPSASDLADLAAVVGSAGVPAIFAETSAPTRLAEALAAEGADVEVVELFGESLGAEGSEAETYIKMVRTNARRIAAALA